MMYDFEYDNIITHWADTYEMNVNEVERDILIESYYTLSLHDALPIYRKSVV